MVNDQDVSEEIRSRQVTSAVSAVATHSGVRELMVEKQRILGEDAGRSYGWSRYWYTCLTKCRTENIYDCICRKKEQFVVISKTRSEGLFLQ